MGDSNLKSTTTAINRIKGGPLRRSGSSFNVNRRNDGLKRRSASLTGLAKVAERGLVPHTRANGNLSYQTATNNNMQRDVVESNEQQKALKETFQQIRKQSVQLRQAIEKEELLPTISYAIEILQTLRTQVIVSPRLYYEIYLAVCNELRYLEWFFYRQVTNNQISILKLYEMVQEASHVLPRLYLLIIAGSVYLQVERKLMKSVLRDLMEMCAGVQHPLRGLFLRGYLTQVLRDRLTQYTEQLKNDNEEINGNIHDWLDFLLRNFTESNRLWIRMQYDYSHSAKDKRYEERRQVETLVGLNISTIARLERLDSTIYLNEVFPAIAQQICSCHDAMAQEFLADCVVQAFPDEYHLQTLSDFLVMCMKLIPGVSIRQVLGGLADRLAKYASQSMEARNEIEQSGAFAVFEKYLPTIITSQGNSLALSDILSTLLSFLQFTLKSYPTQIEYVDIILGFAIGSLKSNHHYFVQKSKEEERIDTSSFHRENTNVMTLEEGSIEERLIVRLLISPLETYHNITMTLNLANFSVLLAFLRLEMQRFVAASLLQSIVEYRPCIGAIETLEKLFEFIRPLVEESPGETELVVQRQNIKMAKVHPFHAHLPREVVKVSTTKVRVAEDDSGYFEQVQGLVARIIYLLDERDTSGLFGLYRVIRRYLYRGGPRRTCITLPPFVFSCLRLAHRRYQESTVPGNQEVDQELTAQHIFEFVLETLSVLCESDAVASLRLYLQGALTISQCPFSSHRDTLLYEFFAQAYLLYEEEIADSRQQFSLLLLIVGTLRSVGCLDADNYDTLSSKAVKHAAKLLTRADQCLALCACSHLFWTCWLKDSNRTMNGLERALRCAKSCLALGEKALLLVDILQTSMYLYENGCLDIPQEFFLDLIRPVQELTNRLGNDSLIGKAAMARLNRAINYMKKIESSKYSSLLSNRVFQERSLMS
eukprot:jgi/Galph1/3920/GphlegSOOS_G2602.1